ncbi:MAG: FAD-binding oxidoreductase [Acidimicrobiales bacterium mtb01]|nr:FAD-binding oxidoreductase [Actinomycetota bacterium]TEX45978.1 MAG: FAD-binding oxidoreductase [Acidimicrobiales bacterium mtb01]
MDASQLAHEAFAGSDDLDTYRSDPAFENRRQPFGRHLRHDARRLTHVSPPPRASDSTLGRYGYSECVSGAIVEQLAAIVGSANVLVADLDRYEVDWTRRYSGRSACVVRPADTAEVAAIVAWARRAGVALVPQGGNTGLVGGSVPRGGEVVVSLERMRHIGPVDALSRQVTVGAGVTIHDLHETARAAGLRYAVDFGARGSATVGGSVATNAGGINVVRYGMTRQQIVGVEAVLGTGEVVSHLQGLVKDNTGFDLASLLCGSEGTLGIVTAVRVRLVPEQPVRVTALAGFDRVDAAVEATASVCRSLDTVDAAELMLDSGVELVETTVGVESPIPRAAAYLLVECSALDDQSESLGSILDSVSGLRDVAIAVTPSQRDALWRLRDEHTPSINTLGPPLKFDVTVPIDRLSGFVTSIGGVVSAVAPGARTFVFGHAADGNMHVNVSGASGHDDQVTDAVLRAVVAEGGSISAEHGIGVAKARWLHLSRSAAEIEAMRAIKGALDPDGVMNPGVLFAAV